MSLQRHTAPPTDPEQQPEAAGGADLDTTAELPVLDVAAFEAARGHGELNLTDTWVAPAPAELRLPPGDDHAAGEHRTRLEEDLRSLSINLRELEDRLAQKGERLAAIETELETTRAQRIAAEQRAEGLGRELTETRLALAVARAQAEDLTQRLSMRDAEARAAQGRSVALEAAVAERERALAHARQQLEALQAQTAAHLEALQSQEGRRGIFDVLLRGLESEVSQRESGIETLQRELGAEHARANGLAAQLAAARERIGALAAEASSSSESGAKALAAAAERERELESARAAQQSRIETLAAELAAARAQHGQALESERAEHARAVAAAEAQVAERMAAVQAELRASAERTAAAEGDLRAAEEAIHRLESDARAKSARIEELTKLNDDWRATLEAARTSLAERDSLIRRLEAEAAHSTALLDHIQQNIRFLDAQTTGEQTAEPATRLLIRAEGDGEVVHVLGRKTSIGRTPDNDVQIDTKFVSRHHAVILAGPAHAIIEDLNSTNGVLVNGRRVTRQSLKDGDAVTIGKTQFRFAVRPPAERRAS
jgi:chromosome segregation ATPase